VFTLDAAVPAELAPLSWLIGVWEGTGVIDYKDGLPYLNYSSSTWLLPGDEIPAEAERVAHVAAEPGEAPVAAEPGVAFVAETGYWRLARPLGAGDPGPAMLPATERRAFTTADEVETLRNADGGFDLEVAIIHPTGVSELYLGEAKGPRIDLATDAVVRSATAKAYSAATRLYGLVDGHLLWAWDIAALGQGLRTHASARLARVD
jgi:hypothetical protein